MRNDNQPNEKHAVEFLVEALERPDSKPGDPKFYDAVMLRLTFSKNHIVSRPVEDADKARYPERWKQFEASPDYKNFNGEASEGDAPAYTKLDVLAGVGPSKRKALEAAGVRSVEALAEADDEVIGHIPGFANMRETALEYVTRKD